MNQQGSGLGQKSAFVVGAGPAGLMAAERLARAGLAVTVFDRMASPARKFLLAGRGGLNLTHSEDFERFVMRYGAAAEVLRPILAGFPPQALRDWSAELGVPTFVGSSGRVFPESFKASPLLRAWLRRLDELGVVLRPRHVFTGVTDGAVLLNGPSGQALKLTADVTVLALGGGSWPRLGSDGAWAPIFERQGLAVAALRPSNCGFEIDWSAHLRQRFAGTPLKNIALEFDGERVRGEAMVADYGIEGGVVYALSPLLREAIARDGQAMLNIDLRPDLEAGQLATRLAAPRGKASMSSHLRKAAGLPPLASALLYEAGALPGEPMALAERIKALPLRLLRPRPIERAISSAGGISFDEVNEQLMLKRLPGVFVAGEMLDWEAPTGGYLLQASFATGFAAGEAAAKWAQR
ncbi:MAG: NAD(FAD)-utilizing dehydrogenase [Rhizobiales bacterium 62-17]|nr:TIGR03862 family flavoprotein [Hyphomicrobiales bacterium]OJY03082.1 MAG: NAD(FAD)-utilizing dehydrogenase [Rhizobiales bacterium 62-17]